MAVIGLHFRSTTVTGSGPGGCLGDRITYVRDELILERFRRYTVASYNGYLSLSIGTRYAGRNSRNQPIAFHGGWRFSTELGSTIGSGTSFRGQSDATVSVRIIPSNGGEEIHFDETRRFVPQTAAVAAFAVLPLCWATQRSWTVWRRRGRGKPGLCLTCGYDVRASKERCPECGAAIPETGDAGARSTAGR
jgi:hypothetical protein